MSASSPYPETSGNNNNKSNDTNTVDTTESTTLIPATNNTPTTITNNTTTIPTPVPLLFFITIALDLFSVALVVPLMSEHVAMIQHGYGNNNNKSVDPAIFGAVQSIYGFMQLLSTPIFGVLGDIVGKKPVLMVSFLGTSLAYALLATSLWHRSLLLFIVSRLIVGGLRQTLTTASAYVSQEYGRNIYDEAATIVTTPTTTTTTTTTTTGNVVEETLLSAHAEQTAEMLEKKRLAKLEYEKKKKNNVTETEKEEDEDDVEKQNQLQQPLTMEQQQEQRLLAAERRLLQREYKERRRVARVATGLSRLQASTAFGFMLGPAVGGAAGTYLSPIVPPTLSAAVGALNAFVIYRVMVEHPKEKKSKKKKGSKDDNNKYDEDIEEEEDEDGWTIVGNTLSDVSVTSTALARLRGEAKGSDDEGDNNNNENENNKEKKNAKDKDNECDKQKQDSKSRNTNNTIAAAVKKESPIMFMIHIITKGGEPLALLISMYLFSMAYITLQSNFSAISRELFNVTPLTSGVLLSISSGCSSVMTLLLLPRLVRRVPHRHLVLCTALAATILYGLQIMASSFLMFAIIDICVSVCSGMNNALNKAKFSTLFPPTRLGQALSVVFSLDGINRVVAPLLSALLLRASGASLSAWVLRWLDELLVRRGWGSGIAHWLDTVMLALMGVSCEEGSIMQQMKKRRQQQPLKQQRPLLFKSRNNDTTTTTGGDITTDENINEEDGMFLTAPPQESDLQQQRQRLAMIMTFIVCVMALLLLWWSTSRAERRHREEKLARVRRAAAAASVTSDENKITNNMKININIRNVNTGGATVTSDVVINKKKND